MEKWKKIVGFENYYQVSNKGRVRCFCDNHGGLLKTPRILKQSLINSGYLKVTLKTINVNKGKRIDKLVHRLVAESFIPNINGKNTVNHKNGNKEDNNVSNLEWNTYSENIKHAFNTGIRKSPNHKGDRCPRAKISNYSAKNIIKLYQDRVYNQSTLGKIYGISQSAVSALINGKNWNKTISL